MATSGTVSNTVFRTRKILEHAYRRIGIAPERLTPQRVETALDLLYLRLSAMANEGITLWSIQTDLIPLYAAQRHVLTPLGTVDVLNCNLRSAERASGTASASEGTAANAFDGDLDTSCDQVTDGGWIQFQLDSATRLPIFGFMPAATGTWDLEFQGSNDGVSFETFHSLSEFDAVDGEWYWFDVDQMKEWEYYRMQAGVGTTLEVREFFAGNRPREIPLALINRDDFMNLPDKTFLGRPTQFWFDKQRLQPVIQIWPAVGAQFTFYQLPTTVRRHIQDPGTLRQELEIPQRWQLAIIARLGGDLALEDDEADPSKVPIAIQSAETEWMKAWNGESDSSPAYFRPYIAPYTR